MKKCKSLLALLLTFMLVFASFGILGTTQVSAATYAKIPALQISRVFQPHNDTNGHCYWASMATVQGYCLGSYTYGGITTNYRVPGQDYNYLSRGDALSKFCQTLDSSTYANNANNLTKKYPVKMTRVTDGIGKNAATYKKIYDQLALGKPVIVYTGTHASVVIGYSGSTSTLEPKGFTVLEVKKDKANTSSGYWWVNSATYFNKHANSPQIDSNTLKTNGTNYMSCYVNLQSWIEYCGNKLQEICYPTNAVINSSVFSFDANGGTGTMADITVNYGDIIEIPPIAITNEGYTFAGYNVCRASDGAWYCNYNRWQSATAIRTNNYEKKIYSPGEVYNFSAEWLRDGGYMGTGFTFYPVWKPLNTSLYFYGNYSGTNYMMSIKPDTFSQFYQSRNSDVYTLSTEGGADNTILKITGKSAGSSGKDLLFKTQTNLSPNSGFFAGDNKEMQLSFKAKASVDGAKMYFRWGYTTDLTSVTLTTEWQEYTIDMNKQPNDGAHMHPYFDKAGTFYISDIVLRDSRANNPSADETSDLLYTRDYKVGTTFGELPTPQRTGYTFTGWYTSKLGGVKLTKNMYVFDSTTAVYAHWEKISDNTGKLRFGDTDLSGDINVKDATAIQKGIAGIITLSKKQTFAGNVIDSDELNIKDATAIQKWCAGINSGAIKINTTIAYNG